MLNLPQQQLTHAKHCANAIFALSLSEVSRQHIGQHGAAAFNAMLDDSRPATQEEYADLQAELESMEYELAIVEDIDRQQTLASRHRQLKELSL